MINFRLMSPDDWQSVSQVDTQAFNSYYQKTGRDLLTQNRTRACILAGLALNPPGCFVAEEDHALVGYIFARIWGKVGWVGVFGVDPNCHGQGVGQKLLMMSVHSLEQSGCTTIGLETMPDSPYNVGFYTRLGFNPVYPTLYLSKPSSPIPSTLPFGLLSKLGEREANPWITSISRAVNPNLDYALEAHNAQEYGWGDTLLFGWPQPWGFSIVRTAATRGDEAPPVCEVSCTVLAPQARSRLAEVLPLLQNYAFEKQASQITLPVYAADSAALQAVVANGFRVNRVMLRMICRGEYPRLEGIDMSRWIM
jgi:ribosomal protein S18 acetylase RimI-like enzyme